MSSPDVQKLLSPMIDRKVELSGPGLDVDRQGVMARIREARHSERRQQRWKRVLPWAAAAAVILAAGGFLARQPSGSSAVLEVAVSEGSATQLHGSTRSDIAKARTQVPASGELETADGSKANVRTADGVNIDLGASTRVVLDELQTKNRRLELLRGAVRCAVPHQSASQPFQVVTPDATIVDIGTIFTVSVGGPDHATRVVVQEGEVMVRHAAGELRVRAPGSWSSSVTAAAPESSTPAPTPDTTTAKPAPPVNTATPARPPRSEAPSAATLSEEAQLLRQGLTAERQGRFSDARSVLSTLLRKYPGSSVAPDARAALARVEAREQR